MNGSFNDPAKWGPSEAPDGQDTAIFRVGDGTAYTVTFPGNSLVQPIANYVTNRLRVGSNTVGFVESTLFTRGPSTYTLTNLTIVESGRGSSSASLPAIRQRCSTPRFRAGAPWP